MYPPEAPVDATPAAEAACITPVGEMTLLVRLAEVQLAFDRMDEADFQAAITAARSDLRCVAAPLSPTTAARVHRAEGLAAWLLGDSTSAERAFAAERAADPEAAPPAVPPEHPLQRAWARLPARAPTAPLDLAAGARAWWDGTERKTRPAERPGVLQVVQQERLVGSTWLMPGAPLPPWATPPPATTGVASTPPHTVHPRPLGAVLGAVAVAGAATSAGTWLVAAEARDRFLTEAASEGELDTLRARTNSYFLVSVGAAIASGGLAVGAAFAW